MEDEDTISITICGDGGCGKSSITLRLVRDQWTNDYDPTIEDSYSVTRVLDGHTYHLHLTDTAGQEEYRGLFGASGLQTADAFLLVYDITKPSSLQVLQHFVQLIDIEKEQRLDRGGIEPVRIIAANKCDLQGQRQVKAATGIDWARAHGCGFMETSARNMVNIEETFALLVRRVAQARRTQSQEKGRFGSPSNMIPHAAGRTKPLTPLEEKSDPYNNRRNTSSGVAASNAQQQKAERKREKQENSLWARLKCW